MKHKWIIDVVIAVAAVAALAVWLLCFPPVADAPATVPEPSAPITTAPSEPTEEDDVYIPEILSFTGKILEIDGESVLIKCIDSDRFDTVWANISGLDVTPQVGEEYVVYHENLVMPSLPPRITVVKMTSVVTTITPSSSTTSTTRTTKTTAPPETFPTPGKRCPGGKHDLVEVDMPATCLQCGYKIIKCQLCMYYVQEKTSDELGPHTFEKGSDTCSVCKKQFVDQYLKNWLLKGNGKTYPGIEGLTYDMGEDPHDYDNSKGRFYLVYDKAEDLLCVSSTDVIADLNIEYCLYLKDEKTIVAYCVIDGEMRCQGEYRYIGNNSIQLMVPDHEYVGIEAERDKKNAGMCLGGFVHDVRDKLIQLFKENDMSVKFTDFDFYNKK